MIWGYSDLTVIQHYFFAKRGTPWVHAPMLGSSSFFNPNSKEASWWKRSITQAPRTDSHRLRALSPSLALRKTDLRATLLGGNLACLVSMMGTPWEPRFPRSTMLFLEDIHEPAYKLDRLLHQLGGHRDISHVKAIVLGHFTECPHAFAVFRRWAESLAIPTYRGVPAGHQAPHVPLLLGVNAELSRSSPTQAELLVETRHLGLT